MVYSLSLLAPHVMQVIAIIRQYTVSPIPSLLETRKKAHVFLFFHIVTIADDLISHRGTALVVASPLSLMLCVIAWATPLFFFFYNLLLRLTRVPVAFLFFGC